MVGFGRVTRKWSRVRTVNPMAQCRKLGDATQPAKPAKGTTGAARWSMWFGLMTKCKYGRAAWHHSREVLVQAALTAIEQAETSRTTMTNRRSADDARVIGLSVQGCGALGNDAKNEITASKTKLIEVGNRPWTDIAA